MTFVISCKSFHYVTKSLQILILQLSPKRKWKLHLDHYYCPVSLDGHSLLNMCRFRAVSREEQDPDGGGFGSIRRTDVGRFHGNTHSISMDPFLQSILIHDSPPSPPPSCPDAWISRDQSREDLIAD